MIIDQYIRLRAFYLWRERGSHHGNDSDDWLQAAGEYAEFQNKFIEMSDQNVVVFSSLDAPINIQNKLRCLEEAGHAVVGVSLGRSIEYIKMSPGQNADKTEYNATTEFAPDLDQNEMRYRKRKAVIHLAGPIVKRSLCPFGCSSLFKRIEIPIKQFHKYNNNFQRDDEQVRKYIQETHPNDISAQNVLRFELEVLIQYLMKEASIQTAIANVGACLEAAVAAKESKVNGSDITKIIFEAGVSSNYDSCL